MLLGPPLLALVALSTGHGAAAHAARAIDDWVSVDDPDLARLPAALRALPFEKRAAYESAKKPWFLLARCLRLDGDPAVAFAADEQVMAKHGEFIPLEDDDIDSRDGEALLFESDWRHAGERSRVLAAYTPVGEGVLHALWLVAPESETPRKLLAELKACLRELRTGLRPPTGAAYASLLNGHQLSFALHGGRGRDAIALASAGDTAAEDALFFAGVVAKHPHFHATIAGDFRDEGRDLTLSYQIFQSDMGLGPRTPLVHWLAEELQLALRRNPDDGDVPVELLHLENARTHVVSQEEVERHYANNRRATDAGVILQTFLPRSPYARACRLRWTDEASGRPSLALFVELRTYPRSRSETVARCSVVLLLARAAGAEALGAFEAGLGFASQPLENEGPLSALPR